MIIKRDEPEPHYEFHFDKRVDFITIEEKKIGTSKIHIIEN